MDLFVPLTNVSGREPVDIVSATRPTNIEGDKDEKRSGDGTGNYRRVEVAVSGKGGKVWVYLKVIPLCTKYSIVKIK